MRNVEKVTERLFLPPCGFERLDPMKSSIDVMYDVYVLRFGISNLETRYFEDDFSTVMVNNVVLITSNFERIAVKSAYLREPQKIIKRSTSLTSAHYRCSMDNHMVFY